MTKIVGIFRFVNFLFLSYYLQCFSYISFNPVNETVLSSVSFSSSTTSIFFFPSLVFLNCWILRGRLKTGVINSKIWSQFLVMEIPLVCVVLRPHSDLGCATHPVSLRCTLVMSVGLKVNPAPVIC